MKQRMKQCLAFLLIGVLLLGLVPDTAYAEETDVTENAVEITTETTGEVSEEPVTEEENTTETEMEKPTTQEDVSTEELTTELTTEEDTPTEAVTEEPDTEEQTTETVSPLKTKTERITNEKAGNTIYTIYSAGSWGGGYYWYVNPANRHYVFCLNHGFTMYSGQYSGSVTSGYSGYSAFKKAVALNYFYKSNGNSWGGTKNYGTAQQVIWDWNGTDATKKLTTYIDNAWKVTSDNEGRTAGTSSYSTKLKGIWKSHTTSEAARKKMISEITSSNNVLNLSHYYKASDSTIKCTVKLGGTAWKYFNNGGYNGGSSDIVVDGIYKPDGTKLKEENGTASVNSDGNLVLNLKTFKDKQLGDTKAHAYTVIMHINLDYQGAKKLNYLLTPAGKQNLTYSADFTSAAYFAVKVYGDSEKIGSKLYINKVDEYGTFVPGCTFALTGVQGEALTKVGKPISNTITDEGQYFEINYPGYYKLVETAVPSSEYKLDTTEHYVYAAYDDKNKLLLYEGQKNADGSYTWFRPILSANRGHKGAGTASFYYYFPNKYEFGGATLHKYANVLVKYENGKFVYEKRDLDNVGFRFYAAEDIYLGETLIFSAGTELLDGLKWGNSLKWGLNFIRIDGKLVDAENFDGGFPKHRGYTTSNGTLSINNLPPGSYYCVETDLSHPGIVMNIGQYKFDIEAGKTTTINGADGILNRQVPADVLVYKKAENTEEYLSGAEFSLYASVENTNYEGQKLFNVDQTVDVVISRNLATGKETVESKKWVPVLTGISNTEGRALFEEIPYGEYLIAETKAPGGYAPAEKTIRFTHSLDTATDHSSGYVFEYTFENIQNSTFSIYKNAEKAYLNTAEEKNVDAYIYKNEAVKGVVFGVYAEETIKNTLGDVVYQPGDLVTKCTTDEDGVAQFGGALFAGKYYYQELETADDSIYELDDTKYSFEVTGKEKTKILTDGTLLNKQRKGSIEIYKTGGTENIPLENVEFELLDAEKNVIRTYVTDADGKIMINNLPMGDYYIRESKTPDDYLLEENLTHISLSKAQLKASAEFNNKKLGSIKVIKTDGKTKEALKGVEFDLLDADKKVIGHYVTDESGEIYIDELGLGTFYIKETKTLKYYKLDDKPVQVELTKAEPDQVVNIKNYRNETKITVETGTTIKGGGKVRTGDWITGFVIMMFLLSSTGVVAFAYAKKKKGKANQE